SVCLLTTAATNAEPANKPPLVLDQYGDPLPEGAIARIGTVRLRADSPISAMAFSPDGKRLATGCWNHALQIWDVATGKDLRRIPKRGSHAMRWSSDGKLLATAANSSSAIKVWNTTVWQEVGSLEGHSHAVTAIAFSPDIRLVASVDLNDKVARIWDVGT